MAADALGLMDALSIGSAHIVGVSMGGMIGQIIAAEHAGCARSLTSIMSSSGDPNLPRGDRRILFALMRPRPAGDRERAIRESMAFWRLIGSPGFPTGEAELRAKVERSIARCYYPASYAHHLLAVTAGGSRVDMLSRIRVPTLVLHGSDDPLIPVEAGRDTAAHIPGSQLRIFPGMGHDLPGVLVPILVDAIAEHCLGAERAAARAAPETIGGTP
jgi:pimeloyl-ACP methyl ester carboxylesterase